MQHTFRFRRSHAVVIALLVGLGLGWSSTAAAQSISGQARAVQSSVFGLLGTTTTVLADTGTLGDSSDARRASLLTGDIASLLAAGVLHATSIGAPDQSDSESSLADLVLTVGGSTIGADFVMSRARAVVGTAGGVVNIEGLAINGLPITATGQPNQTVAIPGGRVVINEQQSSPDSIAVNALHVIVDGVADIVIASAMAGVQ